MKSSTQTMCFVILHYKDRKVTDACVRSILRMQEQERLSIVIVDNDIEKKEEQREAFANRYRKYPRITVLPVRENGGFSHANNLGYRYAKEKLNASYIILLNNDIEFTQPDFPALLEKSYHTHPCHVLGPDIIRQGTGEHQNPMDTCLRTRAEAEYTVKMNRLALNCFPAAYPLLRWKLRRDEKQALARKKKNGHFYRAVQKDIVPFGACLIFTPDYVERETAAFFPETRFFYEEYLLARRCRQKGYHTLYDPSMKLLHESGSSTKQTYRSEKTRLRFMMERTMEAAEIYLETMNGE